MGICRLNKHSNMFMYKVKWSPTLKGENNRFQACYECGAVKSNLKKKHTQKKQQTIKQA